MNVELAVAKNNKIKHDLHAQLLIIRGFSSEIENTIADFIQSPLLEEEGKLAADLQKLDTLLDEDIGFCFHHIVTAEKKVRLLIDNLKSIKENDSTRGEG